MSVPVTRSPSSSSPSNPSVSPSVSSPSGSLGGEPAGSASATVAPTLDGPALGAAGRPAVAERTIGRYRLGALLGRGGMGEVYRATDERLQRQVAIKRVRPADPADPDSAHRRARLEREAQLVAQLGHPAIVQVFDIVEDDGDCWVVMELVEGRTLAARLDDGPLPLSDSVRYGQDIAAALQVAHQRGIVHRDLKVENVMLTDAGQIKILDFGIAKRVGLGAEVSSTLSVQGQVMGTVRAMSPEQTRGPQVDARSDLFSLGVLLYELVSRTSPFAAATAMDTLVRVSVHRQTSLDELPGLREQVPAALSALVDQLLEKAPEHRPQSAAEVAALLGELAARLRGAAPSAPAPRVELAPSAPAPRVELAPRAAQLAEQETVPASPARAAARAVAELTQPSVAPASPAAAVASEVREARGARGSRRGRLALAVLVPAALGLGAMALWRPGGGAAGHAPQGRAPAPGAAVAAGPDDELADQVRRDPRAAYERGMALLRDFHRPGAVDAAAGIFQRLLAQEETSAPASAGLARAYWHRYMYTDESRDPVFLQQARAAADRAVSQDALLADAQVSLGLVALEQGQDQVAEQAFAAALAVDDSNADAYEGRARLLQRHQREQDAEAAFRQAIARAPRARSLYDDLGALVLSRGRVQDAIALFEQSIALAPDSPYGHSNLGAAYLLEGRYALAAAKFQDALKIRPSASLYSNLGTVLFAQGQYGPAATAFERALGLGGAANYHLHWANLADAVRQLPGGVVKAREPYDHALALLEADLRETPKDQTLQSRRVLFWAKRGDCQRVDAEAPALARLERPAPYTLFRLAVAQEVCAHRSAAIELLIRALAAGFPAAEIGNDPELRALRADPAYHRAVAQLGPPPREPTITSGSER